MFSKANNLARGYTLPIIVSSRTVAGSCSSSIGAITIINDEGWFLTAGHMLQFAQDLLEKVQANNLKRQREAAIRSDTTLSPKDRQKQLTALGKTPKETPANLSIYVPTPEPTSVILEEIIREVDLGIGRLSPFKPEWIKTYPVFKDPSKNFDCGKSLCKLGFPFHTIQPTFDEARDAFELPPGSLPVPHFPSEGIFTRTVLAEASSSTAGIELKWVETSTPGIPGQSGGPTFDSDGVIWAIQCRTTHFPLSFNNSIPPQFFHVGIGVHPTTIFQALARLGVKYETSKY
jgi:hypothetical protein